METSLKSLLNDLTTKFGDRPRRNELLANHTTLRLGGPADVWLAVESAAELVEAVMLARRRAVPVFIIGGGANLLIGDGGVRGLVLENRTRRVLFPPEQQAEPGQISNLVVESGAILPNLARRCAQRGLSGLEWAVGVPGTIGGAVVNNAGAYGGDMAGNLVQAELLSPAGERVWRSATWFQYDYRTSRLKRQSSLAKRWVVLQAKLALLTAPVAAVEARMNAFNERRKATQPPGATIGSMFKNPPHDYAGRLIEAVGLKGHRLGQARISPRHANFFQNLGGARATDMLGLIKTAQQIVADKFGIDLELEIEVVGEFSETFE